MEGRQLNEIAIFLQIPYLLNRMTSTMKTDLVCLLEEVDDFQGLLVEEVVVQDCFLQDLGVFYHHLEVEEEEERFHFLLEEVEDHHYL